jgi:hypothetical protein
MSNFIRVIRRRETTRDETANDQRAHTSRRLGGPDAVV